MPTLQTGDIPSLESFIYQAEQFEAGNEAAFQSLVLHAIELFGQLQEELADELGVNPSSISRWKSGKARPHRLVQQLLAERFANKARTELDALSEIRLREAEAETTARNQAEQRFAEAVAAAAAEAPAPELEPSPMAVMEED